MVARSAVALLAVGLLTAVHAHFLRAASTSAEAGVVHVPLNFVQVSARAHASAKATAQASAKDDVGGGTKNQHFMNKMMEPFIVLPMGEVQVGTPPQTFMVAFDTGSAELILPGSECKTGACMSHKQYDAATSVTSHHLSKRVDGKDVWITMARQFGLAGSLVCDAFLDKVCLGAAQELCLDTPLLVATDESNEPFGLLPYDGIFGLGIPDAAHAEQFLDEGQVHGDKLHKGKPMTSAIFRSLIDKKVFGNDRFAIYIADYTIEASAKAGSKITFGGFDKKRLASRLYWVPTVTPFEWTLKLGDFYVDEGPKVDTKSGICAMGKCEAVFDSSSPLMIMPTKIMQQVKELIGVSDEELGDCQPMRARDAAGNSRMKKLGFMFNGIIFYLDKHDYVESTGGVCLYRFQPQSRGDSRIFLGTPFMRKFYTVFDHDSLKIGLALANHGVVKDGSQDQIKDVEEMEEVAEEAAEDAAASGGQGTTDATGNEKAVDPPTAMATDVEAKAL